MKRKVLLLLWMLYAVTASAQFSGSGTGTSSDPYVIYNAMQLDQVRNFTYSGVYFKLMADIDLTEWIADNNPSQGWLPIGTFRGTFNGNNHKISGLRINRSSTDNVGLFGYVEGTIQYLKIEGDIVGKDYVGGLIGYSKGAQIKRCTFTGKITGNNYTGGITGYAISSGIGNCNGNAEIQGNNYIGGIAGRTYSSSGDSYLSSCVFEGTISGNKYLGGISGYIASSNPTSNENLYSVQIHYSYAFVSIKGSSAVGGIVGAFMQYSAIRECAAVGSVTCTGSAEACGGIVGVADFLSGNYYYKEDQSITSSYFHGEIIGTQYVGGIVGLKNHARINNCYSAANIISGITDSYAGGIIGYQGAQKHSVSGQREITGCVSNNPTISAINPGRIYGGKENSIYVGNNKALVQTKIFKDGYLTEVSDDGQNGTGVGSKTMMYRASYQGLGWDFDNVWNIQETESLPYLLNQTAPPVIESGTTSMSTTISGKSINGGTVYVVVDGKTYTAAVNNNNWSVRTDPLKSGSVVSAYAKSGSLVRSYTVTKTVEYEGEGTASNPYKIYTADELANIKGNACYKLMNNIDVTEYINKNSPTSGWTPVLPYGNSNITLDGDGHTINGFWSNRTEDYTGLFGYVIEGTIKNLAIKIPNGKSVKGANYTGVVAGRVTNANIENITIIGNTHGTNYTGGVLGYCNNSSMSTVSYTGNVKAGQYGGGVTGYIGTGSMTSIMYNGVVSSSAPSAFIGGLAGYASTKISKSTSLGTINSSGSSSLAGGLVGMLAVDGSVEDCYSSMAVSAIGSNSSAAGIVATNKGIVTRCYATGDIKSYSRSAGIVASNDGTKARISYCVAANNKVDATYSSGIVSRVLGGTVNFAPAPGQNNYALKTMSVSVNGVTRAVYDDPINGYAKQQSELTSRATYTSMGWNFSDVWKIDEGSGYPYISYSFLVPTEGNYIPSETPYGDVNGDGKVTMQDANEVVNIYLTTPAPKVVMTDEFEKIVADKTFANTPWVKYYNGSAVDGNTELRIINGFTGDFTAGFYLGTRDYYGYAEYGSRTGKPFTLSPGKYVFTANFGAWDTNAVGAMRVQILDQSGNIIAEDFQSTEFNINTGQNIVGSPVFEMPFDIAKKGNYVIRILPRTADDKNTEKWRAIMFGNVKVTYIP